MAMICEMCGEEVEKTFQIFVRSNYMVGNLIPLMVCADCYEEHYNMIRRMLKL